LKVPEGYFVSWTAVLLGLVVGAVAIIGMFVIPRILAPAKPTKEKAIPYECGMDPASPANFAQIHIRYYVFAILFLIFDVEAVFLFPWAVMFMGSKLAFYAMLIFLAVLLFAIAYSWKKGALEWLK